MPVRPELQVRLPNSPGAFAGLCHVLSHERVNIIAFGLDTHGLLRLVVDKHVRALAALRERRYAVVEREALVANVSASPDGLASALGMLSGAGVNVEYAYGSGGPGGQPAVVIGVDDPMRAATRSGL